MNRLTRRLARAAPAPGSPRPYHFGPYQTPRDFIESHVFSPSFYAAQAEASVPRDARGAFVHFVEHGQFAGWDPSPFFSASFARDVAAARGAAPDADLFDSWDALGPRFCPSPLFDGTHYLMRYGDVRAAGLDPYFHWLTHGLFEGRSPAPFAEATPVDAAPDLKARRAALHGFASLADYHGTHVINSSIDLAALAFAFPETDHLTGLLAGKIPFCSDPNALFGNLTAALVTCPDEIVKLIETTG